MSNYLYTYQHTCKKGTKAYILDKSAFRSVIVKKSNGKKYFPFLGVGYYYWEENLNAAHRWGKKHYNNDYNIVEYLNSSIPKSETLDFLDRRNLEYFKELIKKYIDKRPECKKWYIAQWIEFFKKLQKENKDYFPFKYFRADENHPNIRSNDEIKNKTEFNSTGYYIFLDPLIILCSIDKCDLNCSSKTIVF